MKKYTTINWIYKVSGLTLVLGGLAVYGNNCSRVKLNRVSKPSLQSLKGDLCVTPPDTLTRYNKMLFVVDKSGSNGTNDPDNSKRGDSMQEFLDKNMDNPFYKWGFLAFVGGQVQSYVGDMNNPRFGDASEMQAAIDMHRNTNDRGGTPYLSALSMAANLVRSDLEMHPEEDSIYNIFFMSDGFPTDSGGNVVTSDPNDPYILRVKEIIQLLPSRVFLSTAYYAKDSSDPGRLAAQGLRFMAEAGNGKFVDLEKDGKIDFESLKLGPRPEAWRIKRMVAYNLNSAFCRDGLIDADSDADGLCDRDEDEMNDIFSETLEGREFDPQNRNSLSEDYSDLFSYKFDVLPTGEGLDPCVDPKEDEDFDLLNSCEERMLLDIQANGPTPQWTDELRDVGGGAASRTNPDSDGDGFLDSIEFFTFGLKSGSVNYQNIFNRYATGVTGETIMAEHRHPMRPELFDENSYDLKVLFTGVNDQGENCYSYNQSQLGLYRTKAVELDQVSGLPILEHDDHENVIMLYYIAVPEKDPNGKGYLFYSYQTLSYGQAPRLSIWDFDAYRIPNF